MNRIPEISVCLPFYNAERYIKEAVESVLNQTFKSFELLLINDGSTDNCREIINEYKDERICIIDCEHNYIRSMNIGLEVACAKYVVRMDVDDIMYPERLQVQYDFMESHPEIVASGSGMKCFGDSTEEFIPIISPEELSNTLLLYSTIANPTSIIRRSVLMDHNLRYDEDYMYAEDYKLWTEIVKFGKLGNIPQILLKYRISPTQITNIHNKRQNTLAHSIRREMVEYYFSLLSGEAEIVHNVRQMLIPTLDKLNEQGYFSPEEYFQFVYALVRGLRSRNLIKFKYEK